ncbi:MAG: hypothetical protein ACTSU3_00845 [Candidatus Thorarchaeota archaeon]
MSESPSNDELQLPFTHGIEVELQVIRKDGTWLRGEDILNVFDKLISNAMVLLDKRIRAAQVTTVKEKYSHSSQTEEGERGSRVIASYKDAAGVIRDFTLIGHDPNVTSLTWILEIATPPCTTLEELAWWVQTLIAISYESLPKDSNAVLISTGLNPTQEYLKNLSFGEHHHILGPEVEDVVKIAAYNMFRNFLPHIIALSVNSPFENKSSTDEIRIDDKGRTRAPKCKRSIRLFRNTTQMGPITEFELIPYLKEVDVEGFARHVNRSFARMVDMYPYTDYGTIEVRVIDTQLSVPRRIGLALILQALALKAKKMVTSGENIPDVGAKSLAANRESAVDAGLWGPFRPSIVNLDDRFTRIYNQKVRDDGTIDNDKKNRYMGDAVISMLNLIRNELEELRAIDNPFLQPILVSIFGSELIEPKTTGADFQIDVYAKSEMNMVTLLKKLTDITRECCTNWLYDPLEGTPTLPTWLCWWKGLVPEIITDTERVIAGQDAEFNITLRNAMSKPLENVSLFYAIEDSERHIVEQEIISISRIEPGEISVKHIEFRTKKDISAYNILVNIGMAGREIKLSSTINTYWVRSHLRPGTTTQFADGHAPVFFSGEIETNYPTRTSVNTRISVLAPKIESILAETTKTFDLESGNIQIFQHSDFPPLIIPLIKSEGVQRCVLKFDILDDADEVLTSATSRPFYVGYVHRGPQLIIHSDLKRHYEPGEKLQGLIQFRARGFVTNEQSKVKVGFYSDSENFLEIAQIQLSDLVDEPVGFEWVIPTIDSELQKDRTGVIRLDLLQNSSIVTSTESTRFAIEHSEVFIDIDSFRVTERSFVGGKISGWLRVHRNTDQGEAAVLTLALIYPDDGAFPILTQSIKQNRNLSISYGPLVIPSPKKKINPDHVILEATITYLGKVMDSRQAIVKLADSDDSDFHDISFSGIPGYSLPDDLINSTINVSSKSDEDITGELSVEFETVLGKSLLFTQTIEIAANQTKVFPFIIQVPLAAEMSTAHIKGQFKVHDKTSSARVRMKIKAIEEPLFHFEYSISNEDGTEVPGLVPRITPILLNIRGETKVSEISDLSILLRVMSRRIVVKQFEIPFPELQGQEFETQVKWLTPPVDVVTGYYLETVIEQKGKPLTKRAVKQVEKQFTVY